jgi:hypothetical protein
MELDHDEHAAPVEPLTGAEIDEIRVFIETRKRWRWLRKMLKSFVVSSLGIVSGMLVLDTLWTAAAKRLGEWFK